MHDEPYSPAEALGQALTRAEAAEAESRELRINLEDADGRCNRLGIQLRELQEENRDLRLELEHAGEHCVQIAVERRRLSDDLLLYKLLVENLRGWKRLAQMQRGAREAQAG